MSTSSHLLMPRWWNGRHDRLKIYCPSWHVGSNPVMGTVLKFRYVRWRLENCRIISASTTECSSEAERVLWEHEVEISEFSTLTIYYLYIHREGWHLLCGYFLSFKGVFFLYNCLHSIVFTLIYYTMQLICDLFTQSNRRNIWSRLQRQKHQPTQIQNLKKRNYHQSATMGDLLHVTLVQKNKPKHRRKLWQKQLSSTKPNTVIVSE